MRKALRLAVAIIATGAFAPACSHEIESPAIASNRVEPDLACNAKPASRPFSTVTIHGSDMTPMPQKTLEDKRYLKLPEVRLTMVTPLANAAPLSAPLKIVDEESAPESSRVHWTSESEMSFDIHEEDQLPTGVMSIEVTAPDTKAKTIIAGNLAIVPKPTINELKPIAICDDQSDQTVIVAGSNFLFFDDKGPTVSVGDKTYVATADAGAMCETVSGSFRETNIRLCNSVKIVIPKGDFVVTMPTKVAVKLTNPAPADCQSTETIDLTINPPPKVNAVIPATVCEGGSTLTISGEGFITGAKAIIDCMGKRVESSSTTVTADGKEISATFGPGATPGQTCDVIVVNPDGCEDRPLPHKTVTVTTGPIVFYVDPPVVYNGVNTQITVFATTIAGDPTITITPAGMAAPVTTLVDAPVAGHVNRRQATIPKDQPAGDYDLKLQDSTACSALLPKAVKVVSDLTVTIKNVVPPFGWTGEDTAITVFRDTAAVAPANKPFLNGARIFLNPSTAAAGDVAVPLVGTSFIDGDRLSGTVPKGTAVKKYDMLVVNPDGTVGLLKNAYDELDIANPPPLVTTATPSSIVNQTGQTIVLTGKNFDADAKVTVRCVDPTGATITPTATNTAPTGGGTPISTTIDGSVIPAGSVCVVRVTNTADGSYFDFSAIGVTNSSFNLSAPAVGTPLIKGRRALSVASGNATTAQRFVYAIGGDNGAVAGAFDDYEFAPVDLFGKMGSWAPSLSVKLSAKRTLAGTTTVGRYVYNIGGNNGAGPVETAERAMILSPLESPEINDVDLSLDLAGLDEGFYQYRVSATFSAADTDNPNGESLASDVFSIRIPAFPGKKIGVTLVWRKPVDSLGATLPNISGYKIYRIAKDGAAGSETLLGSVTGADTLLFKDDGSKMPGTEKPLPLGSTGTWFQLPNMGTKRSAVGVASAFDPADANKMYVYAIMGRSAATTDVGTYEFLPVTIAANGRQTAAGAWTAGTGTNTAPRDEFGTWVVTKAQTGLITNTDTWIYVGSGKVGAGTLTGQVDAAKVQAGGALTAWQVNAKSFGSDHAGYGVCAANNRLYAFGGQGAVPTNAAKSALMESPLPTLASGAWNADPLNMTQARYLHGSAVQSAFIFLIGGQTLEPSAASKTTETVIW
jgi:hypothetical protein